MSTFGRYTGRLRGLSAITGRHRLEYRVSPDLYNALGGEQTLGLCVSTLGSFSALFDRATGNAQKLPAASRSEVLRGVVELAAKFQKEKAAIESRGNDVKAICLYPDVPKKTGKVARERRRATPIHERFHADMRVLDSKLLDSDSYVEGALADLLKTFKYGEDAMIVSHGGYGVRGAKMKDNTAAEEVLARLEEYRQSCARSKTDCRAAHARMVGEGLDPMNEEYGMPDDWFVRLFKAILKKYDNALEFAKDAHKRARAAKDADAEREWDSGSWLMGVRSRRRR